jgi:hypothetical protein
MVGTLFGIGLLDVILAGSMARSAMWSSLGS